MLEGTADAYLLLGGVLPQSEEEGTMPAVGLKYSDIHDHLRVHLAPIRNLRAAYLTIVMQPLKVHLWTLLDVRDDESERQLTKAECGVMLAFPDIRFDFTPVHLAGRDPRQFIPEAAVPLIIRDRDVLKHFQEVLSAKPLHAGA